MGGYYLESRDLLPLLNGITSAFFHAVGNTDVSKEQLTICVSIGRIQGRASLITDIETLSDPHAGALLDENDITIFCIS